MRQRRRSVPSARSSTVAGARKQPRGSQSYRASARPGQHHRRHDRHRYDAVQPGAACRPLLAALEQKIDPSQKRRYPARSRVLGFDPLRGFGLGGRLGLLTWLGFRLSLGLLQAFGALALRRAGRYGRPVGTTKGVGFDRLAVLLHALIQPLESGRALVERHADRGAGGDHVQRVGGAQTVGKFLVLDVHRHRVRRGGDLGIEAERADIHLHRIGLAAIELPVRRFELEREIVAGAHEARHDVVVELAIDGAAIEFVALEGRLDLPRTDRIGLGLLHGKGQRRQSERGNGERNEQSRLAQACPRAGKVSVSAIMM